MHETINFVIEQVKLKSNKERIEFSKKIYPTKLKVFGVVGADIKEIIKELKIKTKHLTPIEKINNAKELTNTNIFECQQIAMEFLGRDKKTLKEMQANDFLYFNKNMDNWVFVDTYSVLLLGYSWRENIIETGYIRNLLKSPDFWQRRIAIVSTIALNQSSHGGKGDTKRTLEICSLAIDDHNDMINKALSWALRELSKKDLVAVADFLKKYESRLHSRVIREVTNKITTGKKN
ncbi:MAG: hypothetical protein Kow0068_04820 [Marinilabiliales bacterium]